MENIGFVADWVVMSCSLVDRNLLAVFDIQECWRQQFFSVILVCFCRTAWHHTREEHGLHHRMVFTSLEGSDLILSYHILLVSLLVK